MTAHMVIKKKREIGCSIYADVCKFIPCSEVGYCSNADGDADAILDADAGKKGGKGGKGGKKGGKSGKTKAPKPSKSPKPGRSPKTKQPSASTTPSGPVKIVECGANTKKEDCGNGCVWNAGYPPIGDSKMGEVFAIDMDMGVTLGYLENVDDNTLMMMVFGVLFVFAFIIGYKMYFGEEKKVIVATEATPLNV